MSAKTYPICSVCGKRQKRKHDKRVGTEKAYHKDCKAASEVAKAIHEEREKVAKPILESLAKIEKEAMKLAKEGDKKNCPHARHTKEAEAWSRGWNSGRLALVVEGEAEWRKKNDEARAKRRAERAARA